MTDRYAVVGNPVAHSASPRIHAEFAKQTRQDLVYAKLLAPLAGFAQCVLDFRAQGGKGVNVTLPFKLEAFELAHSRSLRGEQAQAINTLKFDGEVIYGDNTDGVGLLRDIEVNLAFPIRNKRVLLMGAGGAARGVLFPLLEYAPAALIIVNRTADKAVALAQASARWGATSACAYAELAGQQFDLVINATSASVSGELPPLPANIFAAQALAYDMMYGKGQTPFLKFALAQGAVHLSDGLGMLVEQAAESFSVWRGVRPETGPVIRMLRT